MKRFDYKIEISTPRENKTKIKKNMLFT